MDSPPAAGARDDFDLAPGITLLNHASYGIASRRVLAEADRIRREIESDPTYYLGQVLTDRLRDRTRDLAAFLGLDPGQTTLIANATSGVAALVDSLPLQTGQSVAVLETEYSSVIRAWERACSRADATLIRVPVPLPVTDTAELLHQLDQSAPKNLAYLQTSLVSSSSAVTFPVTELAAWAHARGGRLILDAAHGPGHVPVDPLAWGVDAMFGTVHKWLPTLRPVGLLWLADDLVPTVRPAEVSLTWDSDDLVERFSWPGTFDPVPRLSLTTALDQWRSWDASGFLTATRILADQATDIMVSLGASPTAAAHMPPRLRAFTLPGTDPATVKECLGRAGIRAWVGSGTDGACLLRISTHVYNQLADIEALASQLKGVFPR